MVLIAIPIGSGGFPIEFQNVDYLIWDFKAHVSPGGVPSSQDMLDFSNAWIVVSATLGFSLIRATVL